MKLSELTPAQVDEITEALDMAVEELLVNYPETITSYTTEVRGKSLVETIRIFVDTIDLDGDLYDLPDSKDFAEAVHDYLNLNFFQFEDNDRAQDLLDYAARYNARFA